MYNTPGRVPAAACLWAFGAWIVEKGLVRTWMWALAVIGGVGASGPMAGAAEMTLPAGAGATNETAEVAPVATGGGGAVAEGAAGRLSAPVQVADEITRRLRRMGIHINKTRLERPYDPAGEVC